MTGLPPDFPDGQPDPRDRSQQAARFLDLTRLHQEMMSSNPDDLFAALAEADLDGDGVPDLLARSVEIRHEVEARGGHAGAAADATGDDVRIDATAVVFPPPSTPRAFTLDEDGDAFGDGNGFGRGALDTNPFD